jgi:hypothetical protein
MGITRNASMKIANLKPLNFSTTQRTAVYVTEREMSGEHLE